MLNKSLFSSNTDEWATPQNRFDELNNEFKFTLDPCATPENAKCPKFFTKEQDGLRQNWNDEIVFCNPPYGRKIKDWIKKASEAVGRGGQLFFLFRQGRIHLIFTTIFMEKRR